MIDLDLTLFIQFANFLITLVVLQALLISPIRKQLANRRATMDGLEAEVRDFMHKADTQLAAYEQALKSAREQAAVVRTEAREAAEATSLEILSVATSDAQATVHAAQNALRAEVERTRESLTKDLNFFADAAVSKLLA